MDKVPVTARARRRNLTAVGVSAGLLVFSCICVATLVATFGGHGHKAGAAANRPGRTHTARPATTTTRPAPATTTSSTTTTVRAVTTTTRPAVTTTTTTTAPVPAPTVTVPPTTAAPTTTTTTTVPVTATESVSNSPHFCTVTVRLSTGAHATYALDAYIANPGDTYVFDATLGGYSVEISTRVTGTNQSPQCVVTLGPPVRV